MGLPVSASLGIYVNGHPFSISNSRCEVALPATPFKTKQKRFYLHWGMASNSLSLAVFQTDWFSVHQIWLLTWTGPYNSHIIHAIHVCLYHFKNTNPMILSLQHRNSSVPVITSACRCACAFGHGHCLIARYCWYCSSVDICAQSVVSHTNHIKYIITILYNTRCLDCLMRGSQRRRPKSSLSHETGYPWPTERFRLQNPMKLLP